MLHRSAFLAVVLAACAPACGESPSQAGDADGTTADGRPDADGAPDVETEDGESATPDADEDAVGDAPGTSIDYLIIAADPLAASAGRWAEARAADGYRTALRLVGELLHGEPDRGRAASLIRDGVCDLYDQSEPSRPFYVLILGDAVTGWAGDTATVPAATWRDDRDQAITSDNYYADCDGDHVPDAALGRIPAATDDEVDLVRGKVEAAEAARAPAADGHRINVFASTAGFGEPVDSIIENLAFSIVDALPYAYDLSMTYARQSSPYVWPPESFSDRVYDRLNEGALIVTYVGHGGADGFATLDWSGESHAILDTSTLDGLALRGRSPLLCFVACSTGAFDEGDCVSERILRHADGPSAIIASSEASDSVPNAIFIYEVGQAVLRDRAPTVGLAFVQAKQRLAVTSSEPVRRQIDELARWTMTAAEEAALQRSHLHMYALLADPAQQIAYPGVATLAVDPPTVAAGETLHVTAVIASPADGTADLTLETARPVIAGSIDAVPPDGDPRRDAVIEANYATANDKEVASGSRSYTGGTLDTTLAVPLGVPSGTYHVKLWAQGGPFDAIGEATVEIR